MLLFFCALASSKSVDGLPATVLLWGAKGSSGLVPDVPEAGMLNCLMLNEPTSRFLSRGIQPSSCELWRQRLRWLP